MALRGDKEIENISSAKIQQNSSAASPCSKQMGCCCYSPALKEAVAVLAIGQERYKYSKHNYRERHAFAEQHVGCEADRVQQQSGKDLNESQKVFACNRRM